MAKLWLMLHYRGLSLNGFHVLQQFGICRSPKTVKEWILFVVQEFVPDLMKFFTVFWFDNFDV